MLRGGGLKPEKKNQDKLWKGIKCEEDININNCIYVSISSVNRLLI